MARFALVKDNVTLNVVVLEEGSTYTPPKGTVLVPVDNAPRFGAYHTRYIPSALHLSTKEVDSTIQFSGVEVTSDPEDLQLVRDTLKVGIVENSIALKSPQGVCIFRPEEPGVYGIYLVIREGEEGLMKSATLVRASVRWLFVNTDAVMVYGEMGSPAAVASFSRIPGALISNTEKFTLGVCTIGEFASVYGKDRLLSEMTNTTKVNNLRTLWKA
jgi:hypothetical protein